MNSAAFLAAVLAAGDFEKLAELRGDCLHEPYRLPHVPGAREAIEQGVAAGALTGWLSGSGSSVVCVTRPEAGPAVCAAMQEGFARKGTPCHVRLLSADNEGFRLDG